MSSRKACSKDSTQITDSLLCTAKTGTTLQINYTSIKKKKGTRLKIPYNQKHISKGTSLVAQWLRIRLPMQETRVQALAREDPTCRGAAKPVRHNY